MIKIDFDSICLPRSNFLNGKSFGLSRVSHHFSALLGSVIFSNVSAVCRDTVQVIGNLKQRGHSCGESLINMLILYFNFVSSLWVNIWGCKTSFDLYIQCCTKPSIFDQTFHTRQGKVEKRTSHQIKQQLSLENKSKSIVRHLHIQFTTPIWCHRACNKVLTISVLYHLLLTRIMSAKS